MTSQTAADLRAAAAAHRAESAASFDRCDTDGFLSQWANDRMAQLRDAEARLAENGGVAKFPALFDLDGNLIAAKLIDTKYGSAWALLASDEPKSKFVGFFRESGAATETKRIAANARKGYFVGWVKAPAVAELAGGSVTSVRAVVRRTDGGFSRDVEIVESRADG